MAVSKEHQTYIMDCFADYDGASSKRMFGGLGIFKEGVMFALVSRSGEFYMKGDDEIQPFYEAEECAEWTYQRDTGKIIKMGYWQISEDILDDSNALFEWADRAFDAAKRLDAKKPKSKRKWIGAQ